ncbi:hypothetical protein PBI_JACE_50 [Gordonia phage Jace]|uniref:Uncharacterized protein n=1 Tax=Gordonia phage Jace TaxID=2182360 RepID=A0A2U8UJ76_9CAUD|nr:hypothetical protein HOT28_gp50 [Gordonia phage Jace]AWN03670.1 hypothetical protein PBI_JACE_50 [Gordonia phage Jace]
MTAKPAAIHLIETCIKIARENSDTPVADVAATIVAIENDEHRAVHAAAFDKVVGDGAFIRFTDPRTAIQRINDTAAGHGWTASADNNDQISSFERDGLRITVLCNVNGEMVRSARRSDGQLVTLRDARKPAKIDAWLTA